jgi:hypothetical protein
MKTTKFRPDAVSMGGSTAISTPRKILSLRLLGRNGLLTFGAQVSHEQQDQQPRSEKDDTAEQGPSHDAAGLSCRQHAGDAGGEGPKIITLTSVPTTEEELFMGRSAIAFIALSTIDHG